jgi:hypothetical protein
MRSLSAEIIAFDYGQASERGRRVMSSWYVPYWGGCATVMSIARSRDEAISIACGMLGRGINVKEIGPLKGMRDGNVIDAVEIRKLHTMRAHELVGSP